MRVQAIHYYTLAAYMPVRPAIISRNYASCLKALILRFRCALPPQYFILPGDDGMLAARRLLATAGYYGFSARHFLR